MWYLAQVVSVKNKKYNVFFMDGYSKGKLPESEIRVVPDRERKKHVHMFGQRFYDDGGDVDESPTPKKFAKGWYTILCYQPGGTYWCERDTDVHEKRDIQEFCCQYVKGLLLKGE